MILPRRLLTIAYALTALATLLIPANLVSAAAQQPNTPSGLLISPATAFATINAGSQKTENLTVANYTAHPVVVSLAVKQFTVSNYSYTYSFNPPDNNWVTLNSSQVLLTSNQIQTVPYTINVPKGSPPGGSYYTLFASTTLTSGTIKSTAQAASLLFLTVNGKLVRTSTLHSDSIQRLVFGPQIAFHFDVTNTGNVYYFIYVSGKLHGLTAAPSATPITHLIIPGKVRQYAGTIAHPFLPGVYEATYGYKTDAGASVQKSRLIVYIPPWSIAALLIVLLVANTWHLKKKR
jgi:hypothetical protein